MLERSLLCLPIRPEDRIIVIIQQSTANREFEREIESLFPWVKLHWVRLRRPTSGQLSTFLAAKKFFKKNRGIAIWNCDTSFSSTHFEESLLEDKWDALVPCGKLPGASWSFFKTNTQLKVTAVKEKKRISPWASVGLYYFKDIRLILKFSKNIIAQKPVDGFNEHYVSSLYPKLISENFKIKVCPTDHFLPFGTPEQVKEFWGVSQRQLIEENSSGRS